jgi:hypothetical protein
MEKQQKKLFGRSGLSPADLGKIWTLADMDKDSKLSEPEFIIAMYLIYSKLKGIEIPESIPASLKADAGIVSVNSESTKPQGPIKGNYNVSLDDIVQTVPAQPPSNALVPSPLQPGNQMLPLVTPNIVQTTQFSSVSSKPNEPGFDAFGTNNFGNSNLVSPSFNVSNTNPTFVGSPTGTLSSGNIPQVTTNSMTSLPNVNSKKDVLVKQYNEEQVINSELEKQITNEKLALETAVQELKEIENKVSEEKAKSVSMKEQLKYLKLQIKTVKDQKEQFERILQEKTEQHQEEQELYNMLMAELNEKKSELEKLQEAINKASTGTDSMRVKRREVKEQLASIKSKMDDVKKQAEINSPSTSGNFTPIQSTTTTSNTSGSSIKLPETSNTNPQPSSFGTNDFGSSTFDNFGPPTPKSDTNIKSSPSTNTNSSGKVSVNQPSFDTSNAFSPNNFDNFGTDNFAASNFGEPSTKNADTSQKNSSVTSPPIPSKSKVPPKNPEEDDPFSFSADLSSHSIDDSSKDSFGSSNFAAPVQSKPQVSNTAPSFTHDFGSDNFGFNDHFGPSDFGSPTTNTSSTQNSNVKPISFDNAFDFPSNLAEFDTGKDSFG